MVKIIIFLILFSINILWAEDAYEKNCISCHKELPTSLQQMFKKYLLVYSGEESVKASIKNYLLHPSKGTTVMSDLFIDSYGIKKKTKILENELNEAIEIYWEKFKVFDKLK